MKNKNGWQILKAEVPAGLDLLPGLGADVPVQLLTGKVLQQRLLHAPHHLVLDVQLEGEERLQGGARLAPLSLHGVPAEPQCQLSHWSVEAGLVGNSPEKGFYEDREG